MKKCSKCKEIKDRSEFNKTGNVCKMCKNECSAKYKQENKDRIKEYSAKRYQENKDCIKEYSAKRYHEQKMKYDAKYKEHKKEYNTKRYQENKEHIKECSAKYKQENKEHMKECSAKYRQENKKKIKEYIAKHYQENKEHRKEYHAKYNQENPEVSRKYNAKRRATKVNATPIWANERKIITIYKRAVQISKKTGIKHDVHHIVPLSEFKEKVIGLNIEYNLQILPASEHRKLKGKYDPFNVQPNFDIL